MKMHEIIRQRRQTLGLTQDQLAVKLGVSAPAVNKWEKAASFPDITLLPPLARALGVDLNTLLSFQEDLTEDDIGTFLNQLYETAQNQGTSAAFQLAQEKLRQFPNSDLLVYQLANLLEGIRVLCPGDAEDDRAQEALIGELYERSAQSADPEVREWAVYTLAGRCIAQGDLDRAQQLLNQLSDTHKDKRSLLADLRRKQGRAERYLPSSWSAAASSQSPRKSSMLPASTRAASSGSTGISASRGRWWRSAASAVLPRPKRWIFRPQSGQVT